jgi:hypothetical protein
MFKLNKIKKWDEKPKINPKRSKKKTSEKLGWKENV